ncbi:uncharacterized protein LOC120354532 [Nilaparvata lugens]|uniref:uncharacterized protein LOC120354532 n=1 Tax=Nilaparvata lugens TaxID=108931 RepID=UPI00193DCDD4|nr:uncharacterized protein LOC120354532 [Nilaparvata lugens]
MVSRRDRGGVAVYVRSSLSPKHVLSSPQPYSNSPEFIFIEITACEDKILVGIVYRPPKAGRLSLLEHSLLQIMHSYQHIVLLGDFNSNLLRDSFERRQLVTLFDSINFHIVNNVDPTYHLPNSHTLLDLAVVSDKDYVSSFEHFNDDRCLEDAINMPWHTIGFIDDINDKVAVFNNMIHSIFDRHAPVRTAHPKRKPVPWMNEEILIARRERDKARRVFKRTSSQIDFEVFKTWRNRVKSMSRNAKLRFYHRQFNQNNSTSTLWDNVRRLGTHKSRSNTRINIPLNELNDFFTLSSNQPDASNAPLASDHLIMQFNHNLPTGKFPDLWKCSMVKPIPKSTNPIAPADCRPIHILCSISKALERIVHAQSGFRPNHSTCTALLRITDDIRAAMDKRLLTLLIQFDLSKAFDNVSHALLIHKLKYHCHFSDSAVAWFSSYLSNRFQAVFGSCGDSSNWRPVLRGVPQGSVLGPLLFSVFINNVSSVFSNCSYHLFADDLMIYAHCSKERISEAVQSMNQNIESLLQWTDAHQLILNAQKTKSIILGFPTLLSRFDQERLPAITVAGNVVPYLKSVRTLGLYLDQSLSCKEQTTHVCNRVFAGMHQLKRLKHFLPQSTRILLVR